MKFLNVGCGSSYHIDWVNIDYNSNSPYVQAHDIRKGLPFADETFDAVYSSHVLEHLSPDEGKQLLRDMKRVLKTGGIVRVIVPDFETIARMYLEKLEASVSNIPGSEEDYDWMFLELLDQTVRSYSGGEMGKFLLKKDLKNKEFIRSRVGKEAEQFWAPKQENDQAGPVRVKKNYKEKIGKRVIKWVWGNEAVSALQEGVFRNSGEIHRWMYDRFSLKRVMEYTGFQKVKACKAHESLIPGFNSFELDMTDGSTRKPDSLFMEGKK